MYCVYTELKDTVKKDRILYDVSSYLIVYVLSCTFFKRIY